MIECNIYSGRKGRLLQYQFTDQFESILQAELCAQEISEMDANEFRYPIDECIWLAVETANDNIPYEDRVGADYF